MAARVTYAPITIAARRVLLDALEALHMHRDGLVLVGAQAIYLHTGGADVAIATTTKDSDVAIVPARLALTPTLEAAMESSGFSHDRASRQPGEWSPRNDLDPPVELLVPERLHAGGGRRGARIPPHSKYAARVVAGLEAAAISHRETTITSLEPEIDDRETKMHVATPASLVVAKAHKLGERAAADGARIVDKDAHDLYRLLRATSIAETAAELGWLLADEIAGQPTAKALEWLEQLSGSPESLVPVLAGRAEEIVGDPGEVAQATWALIQDLLEDPNLRLGSRSDSS